jgi:predicted DNA-binding transcriptional regulator
MVNEQDLRTASLPKTSILAYPLTIKDDKKRGSRVSEITYSLLIFHQYRVKKVVREIFERRK